MTKKEREYYNRHIQYTCDDLGISERMYSNFRRLGATLHRLYEEDCNGYCDYNGNWDEKGAKRGELKQERIEKLATERAERLGLHIYIQSDPRGATIYLDKKPIADNDYTKARCIY